MDQNYQHYLTNITAIRKTSNYIIEKNTATIIGELYLMFPRESEYSVVFNISRKLQ